MAREPNKGGGILTSFKRVPSLRARGRQPIRSTPRGYQAAAQEAVPRRRFPAVTKSRPVADLLGGARRRSFERVGSLAYRAVFSGGAGRFSVESWREAGGARRRLRRRVRFRIGVRVFQFRLLAEGGRGGRFFIRALRFHLTG